MHSSSEYSRFDVKFARNIDFRRKYVLYRDEVLRSISNRIHAVIPRTFIRLRLEHFFAAGQRAGQPARRFPEPVKSRLQTWSPGKTTGARSVISDVSVRTSRS